MSDFDYTISETIPSSEIVSDGSYTLSFDSGQIKGWVSFYSYNPDWMVGMNNYFYTFSNGNLYRHNTNPVRNEYYGVRYPSTLKSVFNESPLENKLYKTINIEGTDTWDVTLTSDQQVTGFINEEYFEKKEGAFFAFVRNEGQTTPPTGVGPTTEAEFELRSFNGLGTTSTVSTSGSTVTLNFPLSLDIGTIISQNDAVYYAIPPTTPAPIPNYTPIFLGYVTSIFRQLQQGINRIEVDATLGTPPTQNDVYTMYLKNSVAESHGIIGHYGLFSMVNDSIDKIELFALETEAMKSYP